MSEGIESKNTVKSDGTISRRRFLQILGSASAASAVGCTDRVTQAVLPGVKGDAEMIPGVAVWYSSTCTECTGGCGIQVRTREGRAVKIEGNPDSPINRGGLCALGQAALQNHYDPDRIRQPLKKQIGDKGAATFVPVSWDEAYSTVATALKDTGQGKAFVTGELSGSTQRLVDDWCESFAVKQVVYDPMQPVAVAKANELVFGVAGVPTYNLEKADVLLNFGADFLETWLSPCELARGWSNARRNEHPLRFIHVEPRLSLTAANADTWLAAKPGSEVRIALAVLKILVEYGRGAQLEAAVLSQIKALTSKLDLSQIALETGIDKQKILLVAQWLKEAKHPLVIAGGSVSAGEEPLALLVVVNLINLLLDCVGKTVNLTAVRKPRTAVSKLATLAQEIDKGKIKTLFVYGTNPLFSLPAGFNFDVEALKKVPLVVSFSSHLDETTELADLVLPSSTSLESWGEVEPRPGVRAIVQPTMTPVFDTRAFADMLIGLASAAGATAFAAGSKDFLTYLKSDWLKLHQSLGRSEPFESFWKQCLERGGYFADNQNSTVKVKVSAAAFAQDFSSRAADGLLLYPYYSVKSFDGRAANRPWLQELPDPITSVVWDAWVEIHPQTAKANSITQGDLVTIRNQHGELNVPAVVTAHVLPGVLAVPIGQGHRRYGRFAEKVGGGNVFSLVPPLSVQRLTESGDGLPLLVAGVELKRSPGRAQLVTVQETDNQGKRELARMSFIGASTSAAGAGSHAAHGGGAHHEPKQMYEQRKHPLYEWGLAVDLNVCTGCSACVVACYAENNIAVVGKKLCWQGREMSWLRIERYIDEGPSEELQVNFLPMMCQHCHNAPCEPVCPVFATYHNEEGMNVMVYNRCVGTRYCSNNCSYKVRRFNWLDVALPETLSWQLNPDVTKRTSGIMEKCTFCVQRILESKDKAKDEGRLVSDGEVKPACVQSCPTQALTFGNLNDPRSEVSKKAASERAYKVLDHHLNTQPAVSYLERVKYPASA